MFGEAVVIFLIVIFGIPALMIIFASHEPKRIRQLKELPDFTPTVCRSFGKNALGIDTERKKIAVITDSNTYGGGTGPFIFRFDKLHGVEVVKDGTSITSTKRGSQLVGAAVGGMLLGPAGMILGGLSGSKHHQNHLSKLSLKIYTTDIIKPVHELVFFNLSGTGIEAQRAELVLREIDIWYGQLRAIIETIKNQKAVR